MFFLTVIYLYGPVWDVQFTSIKKQDQAVTWLWQTQNEQIPSRQSDYDQPYFLDRLLLPKCPYLDS